MAKLDNSSPQVREVTQMQRAAQTVRKKQVTVAYVTIHTPKKIKVEPSSNHQVYFMEAFVTELKFCGGKKGGKNLHSN